MKYQAEPVRRSLDSSHKTFRYACDLVDAARYNLDAPEEVPSGACHKLHFDFVQQQTTKREN